MGASLRDFSFFAFSPLVVLSPSDCPGAKSPQGEEVKLLRRTNSNASMNLQNLSFQKSKVSASVITFILMLQLKNE